MTEIELKLLLLLYNMLSKERAKTADMCARTCNYGKWADCIGEMKKMEDDLRRHGYEFVYAGSKTAGEVEYAIYKLTATATAGWVGIA